MKRLFTLLFITFCSFAITQAAPGDTTWVSSHNGTWLANYGNYDTAVNFPNGTKSYRKVYMIFKLGKYACPGSPQYCADWDYTVQNFLMTPTDTFELGRFITPYGRGRNMGPDWTFRYVYDVTDFYPLLINNAQMRIHYSGYSGGFTGKIDFAFIEGTPERTVVGVDRIYKGSGAYGNAGNPIETHFPAVTKTAPTGTESAEFKFTITGHGSDGQGCSEFCSKWYDVLLNNNSLGQTDIWRDDCGFNQVSAQNGTWIYDRGNWCPGALVHVNTHKLTGVTGGNTYDVNVDFQPYADNGSASYITEGVVVYYGSKNHVVDATLQVVKQPTDHEMFQRQNPMCGQPLVTIRNSGTSPISSLKFEHGVTGTNLSTFTWTGTIAPFTDMDITLPEPWELRNGSGTYEVNIKEVNGGVDEDATNNKIVTGFVAPDKWGVHNRIEFRTNNRAGENGWKIYDGNGTVVAQRNGLAANTTYVDTVTLGPSCYSFEMTDNNCDGLQWWANPNQGTGFIKIYNLDNVSVITVPHYLNADFGCGFTQYFTSNWKLGVEQTNTPNASAKLEAYPNPATSQIHISLLGLKDARGTYSLIDATGRVVWQQNGTSAVNELNVTPFANGMYQLSFRSASGTQAPLQTKVLIAR